MLLDVLSRTPLEAPRRPRSSLSRSFSTLCLEPLSSLEALSMLLHAEMEFTHAEFGFGGHAQLGFGHPEMGFGHAELGFGHAELGFGRC